MPTSACDILPLPSVPQLARVTGMAAVILAVAVVPAEYGIDPTGIGAALGLKKVPTPASAAEPAQVLPTAAAGAGPIVNKTDLALRNDEMSATLKPSEGAEINASIKKGQHFVFNGTPDGPVKADMHGEP